MKFDELNIDERILRAVEDMGFEETSPIQTQAIPAVLEGIDVIGQAQTGTGKTAAYSIPMLQKINPDVKKPQAIVLCPTRELAVQVAEEIRKLAKYMSDIKVLPVYGGQEIVRQIKSLKSGVQIIVGTPGRVMDHMRRKTVKFDSVSMVILDDADEMLWDSVMIWKQFLQRHQRKDRQFFSQLQCLSLLWRLQENSRKTPRLSRL